MAGRARSLDFATHKIQATTPAMALRLIIGNKNYSSWSLRPWLAMKVGGIAFDETVVSLEAKDFKQQVTAVSRAGRVPVLIDGDVRVWESLAILEYLAEKFPAAGLWRLGRKRTGLGARCCVGDACRLFCRCASMLPVNVARPVKRRALDDGAAADVARIDAIWSECRATFGGPCLFGRFGAADAMYAPVVWRFHTYAVELSADARSYMAAVMALPAWRTSGAMRRALQGRGYCRTSEVDWPDVPPRVIRFILAVAQDLPATAADRRVSSPWRRCMAK